MAHNGQSDSDCNSCANPHLQELIAAERQRGRRGILRGGLGLAALGSVPLLQACGSSDEVTAAITEAIDSVTNRDTRSLAFEAVPLNAATDGVTLPPGYRYQIVHATGDSLDPAVPAYSNAGTETDDWSRRVGDHHDGMALFYLGSDGRVSATATSRAVLAVNHESSADAHFFHPRGQTSAGKSGKKFTQFGDWDLGPRPQLEVLKEINHHGVSLVEVRPEGTQWVVRTDSALNRRVTAQTPAVVTGPAAHRADIFAMLASAFDPTGSTARGTLNNCGNGTTPWGTYLTCEENWAAYFHMPAGSNPVDAKRVASHKRYGVASEPLASEATKGNGQGWHTVSATDNRFARWNPSATGATATADFRNEPFTFGYIVEIDPANPQAMPAKRVAMGRFAHEAASCSLPVAGQPLAFYMGDDSRNEYIYKFVSAANWDAADANRGITAGDRYLTEGKLYAARFTIVGDQAVGEWLELTITAPAIRDYSAYAFASQADVLINARHAADAVGATKMDRPEWSATNPANGEVYFTLTNNTDKNRTPLTTSPANPRSYADPDGKKVRGNPNGHIVRLRELAGAAGTNFTWDIFLFGAEATSAPEVNLSALDASNAASSVDGLWFSKATGICWIQTDDSAYADVTTCMMLAALPGTVGDGNRVTVQNRLGDVTGTTETFVGAALGTNRLRRFLTAPKGAEVTGLTESADGKALFVNIQHPGEDTPALGDATDWTLQSTWPFATGFGPGRRPRSATIVVTRDDGGQIGL